MASCTLQRLRVTPLSMLIGHSSFPRTSIQLQARFYQSKHRQHECTGLNTVSRCRMEYSTRRTPTTRLPGLRTWRPSQERVFTSTSRLSMTAVESGSSGVAPERAVPSAYKPPTTGILSYMPQPWVPYAELVRMDKPVGTYYLFLPCLFSTLLAAPLASPMPAPSAVLGTSALFFLGAFIMRGAGCTINDLWDRNLDTRVERTRLRPIARGAISVRQAVPFLGFQLLAGLGVLISLPTQCLWHGIPSLLLVTAYPLAKRVTNYPQFVLGLTFSWGAIMGFPALGIDLLSFQDTAALTSAACLYASCVAWTVVYDMIYAYQDIRDDAVAGIKSIALARQSNAKIFLSSVAAIQVGLLAAAGIAAGAGPVFFTASCGGAALTLGYIIKTVNLQSVSDCWRWFRKGAWFTGGAISLGLAGEYGMNYLSVEENDRKNTAT